MISQRCPKCLSKRVRRGYRPTPFWSKVLFRYNLLCDNCNWEFTGFAVPGTVTAKPTKSPKKKPADKAGDDLKTAAGNQKESPDKTSEANSRDAALAVEEFSSNINEKADHQKLDLNKINQTVRKSGV